jgi:hypothetical protein
MGTTISIWPVPAIANQAVGERSMGEEPRRQLEVNVTVSIAAPRYERHPFPLDPTFDLRHG